MGDFKQIAYPFILVFKGSATHHDEMCLFENELTMISIANLGLKGYQYAEIKTFDTKNGAEDYFAANFDADHSGIKREYDKFDDPEVRRKLEEDLLKHKQAQV